jgi:hypothetical protein
MRLPATFRHMIESHKHQVVDFNPTGAHEPRGVPILFHWAVMVFRNKPSDGLRHILCEFRTCDGPRRVAEIPRRDLATPWLITWPINAHRDRRPTLSEHRFVAPYEPSEATMHGVPQRYPRFIGLLHKEVDGWLEVDLINVAASVTGGVGLVSLLWHHEPPLVLAEWNVMLAENDTLWLRR